MANAVKIVARVQQLTGRGPYPLVLELDLTEGLLEGPPVDPLASLLGMRRPRLSDVIDGLRRAGDDEHVVALVARVGGKHVGFGALQELRDAVLAFRATGKRTVAYAETFGEFGPGTAPYYLATAFEQICLQPSGDVGLTGAAIEERFLRGALDKLGVEYQVGQRHEYKSAVNTFREHGFTQPHREADERLVASLTEQVTAGVAEARGLTVERVHELIDRAPLVADEALEAGLVDRLAYRDQVYEQLRADAGEHARLLYVSRYHKARSLPGRLPKPRQEGVALLHATGGIRLGRSGRSPLSGSAIGSDTLAAALRAAITDDKIAAIVLRVNSPGGSYVASDTIWREVVRAGVAGKPVVASMSDVAASGGYFISMAATAIVAQPGTLTGSIGVFGGKPVIGGLLERIGVAVDGVGAGRRSRMFSTAAPFSDDEWERVNTWLDRVYDDFVAKAAKGRRLTPERVHELARGRVWTGADAKEHGLVDELGGLDTAAALARKAAGLAGDAPLRPYPRISPLDRLRPAESSEDRTAATASLRGEAWGPLADLAARAGLPTGGPLMMPTGYVVR